MSRIRKVTAAVSVAALVGAGGIGVAQAASTSSGSAAGTARSDRPGAKRGGPMSTASIAAIAKTLGITSAQLKAAIDATKPAAGTKPDRSGMAAELATALGVDTAAVQTILDANRPARPAAGTKPAAGSKPPAGSRPERGARPDNSKLISALATGLKLDEATVKAAFTKLDAAHKADHSARETAMYAAIATQLGLGTDAVKAAFEANRPAKQGPPPAP
jgi:protein-disulfide isomerase-like protein with CxxC motif